MHCNVSAYFLLSAIKVNSFIATSPVLTFFSYWTNNRFIRCAESITRGHSQKHIKPRVNFNSSKPFYILWYWELVVSSSSNHCLPMGSRSLPQGLFICLFVLLMLPCGNSATLQLRSITPSWQCQFRETSSQFNVCD